MFWNDPNMYGVSFPYKDLPTPVQTPIGGPVYPWLNLPRFVPPTFNFIPPQLNVPFDPYMHLKTFYKDPLTAPTPFNFTPFMDPYAQMKSFNLPQYGFYRPFI